MNGANIVRDWPVWVKFIFAFFTGFAPLLWFCAFLVFLSWEPFGTPPTNLYNLILAIVLLFVMMISSSFSFYQELQAIKILQGFVNLVPENCVVIRDGNFKEISATRLVVGDCVVLQADSRVPADIRATTSRNMKVDKSLLIGESEPMSITSQPELETVPFLEVTNIIFMGSNVIDGNGIGIVIATGKDIQLAKIMSQSTGPQLQTSLQLEDNHLVKNISIFSIVTGLSVALFWTFHLRIQHPVFMSFSSLIANAIGAVVAYIPEGLPLALSMGLSIIAKRLCSKYFVLVKRLGSIETLGSISLLASDKTGTLTQNIMTVTDILTPANYLLCAQDTTQRNCSSDGSGSNQEVSDDDIILSTSQCISALCNQARFEDNGDSDEEEESQKSLL